MEREADRVIAGYLRSVGERLRHLPEDERSAILDNLRAHYSEALSSRCGGAEPTHEDIHMVLAGMDPPEAFGSEDADARREGGRPSVLWLPIIVLGASIVAKLVLLLASPGSLRLSITAVAGSAFGIVVLYGILRTRRWAYWLVVAAVPISCVLSFLRGAAIGLATTAVNMTILVPVLMSRQHFLGGTRYDRDSDTRGTGRPSATAVVLIVSIALGVLLLSVVWLKWLPWHIRAAYGLAPTTTCRSGSDTPHARCVPVQRDVERG